MAFIQGMTLFRSLLTCKANWITHDFSISLLDPITLGLVRDDYPCDIARNSSERTEWNDMPKESYVPIGIDDLFDWVKLQELTYSSDPSRKWEVVHVPRPMSDTSPGRVSLQRLTIRVFGIVGNLNLMNLGNWDRSVILLFVDFAVLIDCHLYTQN